ncbi:MAG TPA: trypsin-like peptidase domain-containing protein [Ktedonobacteraceae bacterium]|nr:trypsin-like peptidase domain-containing protein [Ktedonobacteraceae bacterium]
MSNPYVDDNQPTPYQNNQAYQAPKQDTEPEDDLTAPYTLYQSGTAPQQNTAYPSYTAPAPPTGNRKRGGGIRTGAILLLALVLAVVFGTGLFAGWEFGHSSAATATDTPGPTATLEPGTATTTPVPPLTSNNINAVFEAVVAKVRPTVVQVNVTLANGSGIGSGVIIDKRGYIVTNNHVVEGAQSINVVLYDGTKVSAQVTGTDPADDLAIIKINPPRSNIAVATLGNSSNLQVGEMVLAIGNPLGNTQTVTNGIISALNRTVTEGPGGAIIPDAIQTDAPINPGNSGGALVDLQGNVIGIPTLSAIDPEFNTPANGVGFAIPSNRVASIASQIIATGKVEHTGRAELGVEVADVDPTLAAQDNLAVTSGALIESVVAGGPAAQAGLQPGDVIVQVGNQAVQDTASLGDALASYNPGQTVPVTVYRGSQQLTVNVKLGELPSQAG